MHYTFPVCNALILNFTYDKSVSNHIFKHSLDPSYIMRILKENLLLLLFLLLLPVPVAARARRRSTVASLLQS
jgi:hypothetical protein